MNRQHDTNYSSPIRLKSFHAYAEKAEQACRIRVNIYENFIRDMAVARERRLINADYSDLIKEMLEQAHYLYKKMVRF